VWVPESIINGTQPHLEHTRCILPAHVLIARVCGASCRSLAVVGMWSPACSRRTASALLLVGQQGDPRNHDVAQKRRPEAARPCSQRRSSQERRPAQYTAPNATFAAGHLDSLVEK
jgi:hypothetical protein